MLVCRLESGILPKQIATLLLLLRRASSSVSFGLPSPQCHEKCLLVCPMLHLVEAFRDNLLQVVYSPKTIPLQNYMLD